MEAGYRSTPAEAPATAAIPTTHERIEVEALGIEVLVPAAYARMLRRTGQPLQLDVQLDPEPSPLPPLTNEQRATLDYLRENGVTPAEELSHQIGYSEITIKRWCKPGGPLHAHGVRGTRKGYAYSGDAPVKPPLTSEQRATVVYLREHGITSAEELAHQIGYSTNTIKAWCGPSGPLRDYGVIATKKGYAVEGEPVPAGGDA